MDNRNFLPGDVFFVMHNDNFLSKTIAWFCTRTRDGKKYGHSGIILEKTDSRTYTMETTDFEVVPNILERYINDPNVSMEVWRHPAITITERIAIAKEASLMDEAIYGYFQLFSFALKNTLKKLFGIKVKNFIHAGIICCFVPLKSYNKASSLPMMQAIDPGQLDTSETRELIMDQGFERIFEK